MTLRHEHENLEETWFHHSTNTAIFGLNIGGVPSVITQCPNIINSAGLCGFAYDKCRCR